MLQGERPMLERRVWCRSRGEDRKIESNILTRWNALRLSGRTAPPDEAATDGGFFIVVHDLTLGDHGANLSGNCCGTVCHPGCSLELLAKKARASEDFFIAMP